MPYWAASGDWWNGTANVSLAPVWTRNGQWCDLSEGRRFALYATRESHAARFLYAPAVKASNTVRKPVLWHIGRCTRSFAKTSWPEHKKYCTPGGGQLCRVVLSSLDSHLLAPAFCYFPSHFLFCLRCRYCRSTLLLAYARRTGI